MSWPRHWLLLALVLIWCGLILCYPWLARKQTESALLLALLFSHICHQDPLRSFHLGGWLLPVCSRCTAIYFGVATGVAAYPWLAYSRRPSTLLKPAALAAFILLGLDIGLDLIGLRPNTFLSRSATGSLFGLVCGFSLALAIQRFAATRYFRPVRS